MVRPIAIRCKRGHFYTEENTVKNKRGKSCRICRNCNFKIKYNADELFRIKILARNKLFKETHR